jgi:hypothetical protein
MIDLLEKLVAEGQSTARITEQLGISRPLVCYWLKKLNLTPKKEPNLPGITTDETRARKARIIAGIKEGKAHYGLAKAEGVSRQYVAQLAARLARKQEGDK